MSAATTHAALTTPPIEAHLEQLGETLRQLLRDGWQVAFADVVPHGVIGRQWSAACRLSNCERKGKNVCLGQIAVLL